MNGTTRVCQGVIFDSVEIVKGILQYYFLVFAEVFGLLNLQLELISLYNKNLKIIVLCS
jgi:hypothetical protein